MGKVKEALKKTKVFFLEKEKNITFIVFGIIFVSLAYSFLGRFFIYKPSNSDDVKNIMLFFTWQSNVIIFIFFLGKSLHFLVPNSKFLKIFKNNKIEIGVASYISLTILIPTFIFGPAMLAGLWESTTPLAMSTLSTGQNVAYIAQVILLHYVTPLAVLIPFFLTKNGDKNLKYLWFGPWSIYPIFYLIFTMLWGNSTGWYPYPIINPTLQPVLAYVFIGVIGFIYIGFTFFIIWFIRNKEERFKYFKV